MSLHRWSLISKKPLDIRLFRYWTFKYLDSGLIEIAFFIFDLGD